ncbi:hypothetical protein GCM10009641_14060 [Mycobacterium cookii]|uniref:Muconolactone isomerase domain-containing protein n=1 Tax=Mycobacterium cookii TaxID=1775 RepID=A0A7I7L0E1_9MYCO|nr:hypothetical protein [Mycobacterium cookii]MCV7330599.1 hypothetical protein [Mycobacterium cookii]BBX47208.1 hypothetical protein MCOO_32230 [Mycobacterium cookii]
MDFFVTAAPGLTAEAEAYQAEEKQALNELRAEGVVSAAYVRTDGQGLVGIVHGTDLDDVKAHLARLPFVAHGYMAFDYVPIVPV